VLTHLAPLRSALQAWFVVECVILTLFAVLCDSGLKGRFPVAQGAALGQGPPQKTLFCGLKGRFQDVCCVRVCAPGFEVLTHVALLRPALQAWFEVLGLILIRFAVPCD